MTMLYNNPPADASTIGEQIETHAYHRMAVIEAKAHQVFSRMTSSVNMPKHKGQTLKGNRYIQLMDDRNTSQGLDSQGNAIQGNLSGNSRYKNYVQERAGVPLGEEGGRVNKVGFTREVYSATLENMGFFHEFTENSLIFDTDEDLYRIMSKLLINAAAEVVESKLQGDLLDEAGTIFYTGDIDVTAGGRILDQYVSSDQFAQYSDFVRQARTFDADRVPDQFTMLTGSTYSNTYTVRKSRVCFTHPQVENLLETLVDSHGNPAYTRVDQYADSANYSKGFDNESGTIFKSRVVLVQEMLYERGGAYVAPTGDQVEIETDLDENDDEVAKSTQSYGLVKMHLRLLLLMFIQTLN